MVIKVDTKEGNKHLKIECDKGGTVEIIAFENHSQLGSVASYSQDGQGDIDYIDKISDIPSFMDSIRRMRRLTEEESSVALKFLNDLAVTNLLK